MALEIGSRLGHYDLTALIGEGGMGECIGREIPGVTGYDAEGFAREAKNLALLEPTKDQVSKEAQMRHRLLRH